MEECKTTQKDSDLKILESKTNALEKYSKEVRDDAEQILHLIRDGDVPKAEEISSQQLTKCAGSRFGRLSNTIDSTTDILTTCKTILLGIKDLVK